MLIVNNQTIVATLLVKNEEDIISNTIEHHLEHGVKYFIVTDNRSTDRTREIVEKYPEVKEIIDEPDDTHYQSKSVTRMARMACKLNPDWIIHLDADELWCGLNNLRRFQTKAIGSVKMLLHPPVGEFSLDSMRFYLYFEGIPGECKVAHRPDPEVVITHGNHGFEGEMDIIFTDLIYRHHYPIRSQKQFSQKASGHIALLKRNAICERWERWHSFLVDGKIDVLYESICKSWLNFISNPNHKDLEILLDCWSTKEMKQHIIESNIMPKIGEYPKR